MISIELKKKKSQVSDVKLEKWTDTNKRKLFKMKPQGTGSMPGIGGFLDFSLNLQFYKMKLSYCLWNLQFLLNKIGIFILSLFIPPSPLLPSFIYPRGWCRRLILPFPSFLFQDSTQYVFFLCAVQLNDMVRTYASVSMSVAK